MNIDMSYAEMSFLRDLVSKKKFDIWIRVWLPSLKDKSPKNVKKLYDELMNPPINWRDFPGQQMPMFNAMVAGPVCTELDCCNFLLRRFQKKENEIKKELEEVK